MYRQSYNFQVIPYLVKAFIIRMKRIFESLQFFKFR